MRGCQTKVTRVMRIVSVLSLLADAVTSHLLEN